MNNKFKVSKLQLDEDNNDLIMEFECNNLPLIRITLKSYNVEENVAFRTTQTFDDDWKCLGDCIKEYWEII